MWRGFVPSGRAVERRRQLPGVFRARGVGHDQLELLAGVGLLLLFAGFGKLANLKPFAGVTRLAFGTAFVGIAGMVAFIGLNIQTYKRLTYERPVATVKFVEPLLAMSA